MEENNEETKYLKASIEKSTDGSFIAVASTNTVDRQGEVVDNNGWDLKAFKKNPVILWGHDHSEPAIGTAKKIWVEGSGKSAKLMIQPILHDVTEKARAIKTLVERGIIRTLSVGFKPLESPDGVRFTKNELLEVSMVNVPANSEAVMLAYKSLKKDFSDKTLEQLGIPKMIGELIDKVDSLGETVDELDTRVKALSVNPEKKQTERRLSHLKIIAKAADKLLEADKKNVQINDKQLVKVIKRTTEILTVAEKDKLNG